MRLDQANPRFVQWYMAQPAATQDALIAAYNGATSDAEYSENAPNSYYYQITRMIEAAAAYGYVA